MHGTLPEPNQSEPLGFFMPTRATPLWNLEQTKELAKLWNDGYSASLIAEKLSTNERRITRNSVIGKAHRIGLNCRDGEPRTKAGSTKVYKVVLHSKPNWALNPNRKPGKAPKPTLAMKVDWAPAPLSSRPEAYGTIDLGLPAPIGQLHSRGCKWPTSHDGSQHIFCNRHRGDGRSYCQEHQAMSIRAK